MYPDLASISSCSGNVRGDMALHSCPETPTAFLFPIGLSQVPLNGEGVPRTSQGLPCTLGSCPSVVSVPLSHRESPDHPKNSHPWELSQCPVCPTVPPGVPRSSQELPPLGVAPVSCLSHCPTGSPQIIPRTPTLGSCPSVPSVPQSQWESPDHPKNSHPWELSQCPVCPTVPMGVTRTSQGLPPLGVSCLYYILL